MKISARLVVAFFCGVLIIGPIILLSLFSNATDDAVASFVPLWDGSISRSLLLSVDRRNTALKNTFSLIMAAASQSQSSLSGSDASPDMSFLLQYSVTLTDVMNRIETDTLTSTAATGELFAFALLTPTSTGLNDDFLLYSINFPSSDSIPNRQTAFTMHLGDNELRQASYIFPKNVSLGESEPSMVIGSWDEFACSTVISNYLTSMESRDVFASIGFLSSIHAFMTMDNVGSSGIVAALVSPISAADTRTLRCDDAFELFRTELEFVERVTINSSIIGNMVIQRTSQAFLTATPIDLYAINAVVGSSMLASTIFSVPDGDARLDLFTIDSSENFFPVACATADQDLQFAFQLSAADCTKLELGFSFSQVQRMSIGTNAFVESNQRFLSVTRLPVRFQRTLINSISGKFLYVLLSYPSSTTRDVVNTASTISVIISVSVTAFTFVVTLTTLHYIFHALKIIGTLLRACADIRLQNLEEQSPLFVSEIFFLQLAVDSLLHRMLKIGKYMPDKSQLYQLLRNEDALTDFSSTPIGAQEGIVNSRWSGAVAHTVTVIVEYRSRAKPSQARMQNEVEKKTVFEFVYTGQENVFSNLEAQCRERLGERVGESLQLYDQNMLDNPSGALGLTCNEDVIEMIQRANNRTLRLVVMKTSSKQYFRWLLIVWSFFDVAVLVLCGVELAQSTAGNDSQIGITFLMLLVFRFGMNLVLSMYLIRHFAKLFSPFAQWVPLAMQETMIATLLSCASAANIRIIFSATRLTKALRFNAPYTEAMRPTIIRVTFGCVLYSNVVPLCLGVYSVAKSKTSNSTSIVLILIVSTISIVIFACENFLEKLMLWWKLFRSDQDGFGDRGEALQPIAMIMQDEDDADDDYILSPSKSEVTSNPRGGGTLSSQGSSLNLGLSVREATILRVTFRNASAILSSLSTQETQKFSSSFFAVVFSQAKIHGAIVLHVFNCDVTLGFNCHQDQSDHKTRAFLCFLAISQSAKSEASLSQSSSGNSVVCGALLSSDKSTVGFVGSGETRAFQHLGHSSRELDTLFRIGNFYGCELVTTSRLSHQIENSEIILFDSSQGVSTRIIDTVAFDSLIHARDTVVGAGGHLDSISQRRQGLQSRYFFAVYEVFFCADSALRSRIDSSRAVMAPIEQQFVEMQAQFGRSLTSAVADPIAQVVTLGEFLSPLALIGAYLAKFPLDFVMKAVEQRLQGCSNPRIPRNASTALGVDLLITENVMVGSPEGDPPPPRPQLTSLATSKNFTLYFTDL